MAITLTAFKEKLRRKELYIVSVIGVLLIIMFGSGTGQLSIDGVAVTDYKMLAPIILITVNAVCCFLSVLMSLNTIPNEYERHTSHLIWIRGVSQARYHGELAAANVMSGIASELILFMAVLIFMFIHGKADEAAKLVPAFIIIGINIVIVCLMTSAFTVILPKLAAGAVAAFITIVGIFYDLIILLKDILGGFAGIFIKVILTFLPNLNEIQAQAGNALCSKPVSIHIILKGLFAVYIFAVIIMLAKKKEA